MIRDLNYFDLFEIGKWLTYLKNKKTIYILNIYTSLPSSNSKKARSFLNLLTKIIKVFEKSRFKKTCIDQDFSKKNKRLKQ